MPGLKSIKVGRANTASELPVAEGTVRAGSCFVAESDFSRVKAEHANCHILQQIMSAGMHNLGMKHYGSHDNYNSGVLLQVQQQMRGHTIPPAPVLKSKLLMRLQRDLAMDESATKRLVEQLAISFGRSGQEAVDEGIDEVVSAIRAHLTRPKHEREAHIVSLLQGVRTFASNLDRADGESAAAERAKAVERVIEILQKLG